MIPIKEIENIRDDLYNSLPTGEVTAWDMLQVIKEHIKKLDALIEKSKTDL